MVVARVVVERGDADERRELASVQRAQFRQLADQHRADGRPDADRLQQPPPLLLLEVRVGIDVLLDQRLDGLEFLARAPDGAVDRLGHHRHVGVLEVVAQLRALVDELTATRDQLLEHVVA